MPVCLIDLNGNIQRFENIKDMNKKTGITQDRISDVMNRDNYYYESKGVLIIRENNILLRDENSRILKDEFGNYRYDLEKVSKLMETFMEGKIRPVIARRIEADEVLTFRSATEAARHFSLSKQAVDDCLKNKCLTCKGYHFDYYDKSAIKDFLGL